MSERRTIGEWVKDLFTRQSTTVPTDLLWRSPDTSGSSITVQEALSVPAVGAAVQFISDTVAMLPISLFRRDNNGIRDEIKSGVLYNLLNYSPAPGVTNYAFLKHLVCDMLLYGRGIVYIERSVKGIRHLWRIEPNRIQTKQIVNARGFAEIEYTYTPREGKSQVYSQSEVIDVKYMPGNENGECISPLSTFGASLRLSSEINKYTYRQFKFGGMPLLAFHGPFQTERSLKQSMTEIRRGLRRAHSEAQGIIPMPIDHELRPIGVEPQKSQMMESRRYQVEEVARIFKLPIVFLQDLSRGTYNNSEQQGLWLSKHTIAPICEQIAQEINVKILTGKMRCSFDLSRLHRGDFTARVSANGQLIATGQRTINEVRASDDLPPVEDGDRIIAPLFLDTLTEIAEGANKIDDGTNQDDTMSNSTKSDAEINEEQ